IGNVTNSPSSLRPWPLDLPVGLRQLAGAQLTNRTDYRARHIAHLFLHVLVLVERVVAVVVRFVKADVTIKLASPSQCALLLSQLNRSTQHFIVEGKDRECR